MKEADRIIENLITRVYNSGDIVIPNYYYNGFEADLFRITSTGYIYEYEIKISVADLNNDYKKFRSGYNHKTQSWYNENKHELLKNGLLANRFYFVTPKGLIEKKDLPDHVGLLEDDRTSWPKQIKTAPYLHRNKFPENNYISLAKQLALRAHTLKIKNKNLSFHNKELKKELKLSTEATP